MNDGIKISEKDLKAAIGEVSSHKSLPKTMLVLEALTSILPLISNLVNSKKQEGDILKSLNDAHNNNLDIEIRTAIAAEFNKAISEIDDDAVKKWLIENEKKDQAFLRDFFGDQVPEALPPKQQIQNDIKVIREIVTRRKAAKNR